MTPIQDLKVTMANGDTAIVTLFQDNQATASLVEYRPQSGTQFDPGEKFPGNTLEQSLDHALGVLSGFLSLRETNVVTVDSICNQELIKTEALRDSFAKRKIEPEFFVNGKAA